MRSTEINVKSKNSNEQQVSAARWPAASDRPFIIPVFLPHAGCPHRCVFCNQVSITGKDRKMASAKELRTLIQAFLKYKKDRTATVQIAFFGGNFLGINLMEVTSLLRESTAMINENLADSIRFSTRPDTIDRPRLDVLRQFPVATIELGVQSMDDRVLALSRRGHSRAETIQAVELLKERNYEIGLQVMVGLPGDDPDRSLETGRQIVGLKPDFVRIYPTVVLAGSPLARWYQNGKYVPLTLPEAVQRTKNLYLLFKNNRIKVIRMGLQASEDLENGSSILAGPYHPAFGQMVYSEIFLTAVRSALTRTAAHKDRISIHVHPVNISKMRGLKNANVETLKAEFNLRSVAIAADGTLGHDMLRIHDSLPFSIYAG